MATAPAALPNPLRRALPRDAIISTWQAPDGWPIRRFDWPAATEPEGAILFLGGRGDIFEKYFETFDHWHRRDWSVTAIDWRGHGGSGRTTAEPAVGHLDSFATLVRDLTDLWSEWAPGDGPRVLVGHSMGGHVVLRALAEGVVAPTAAALVSPMVQIRSPLGATLSEWLAGYQCRRGDPARPAWRPRPSEGATFDGDAMLTGDYGRLLDEHWWHARMPGLRLGPPSWGWLAAAFASCRGLQRVDWRRVATPALLLTADGDRLTDSRASLRLARRWPDLRVLRLPAGAGHELLRECDPVRDATLAAIDALLDAAVARQSGRGSGAGSGGAVGSVAAAG